MRKKSDQKAVGGGGGDLASNESSDNIALNNCTSTLLCSSGSSGHHTGDHQHHSNEQHKKKHKNCKQADGHQWHSGEHSTPLGTPPRTPAQDQSGSKRASSKTGLSKGCSRTSSVGDDWITDMLNNNMHSGAANHSSADPQFEQDVGKDCTTKDEATLQVQIDEVQEGDHISKSKCDKLTNCATRTPSLGAVIQLVNVSVYRTRGGPSKFAISMRIFSSCASNRFGTKRKRSSNSDSSSKSDHHYFTSLNVSFYCGQIFAIVGPRESGKSALLETISQLRKPASGKVRYLVPSVGDKRKAAKCGALSAGYMAQHGGYFGAFTAPENVRYMASVHGVPAKMASLKLARLMSLIGWDRKHVPAARLQSFERTLLSLALASIHSPAILLLDEPHFGADIFRKTHIWRQLKHLTVTEHVTIIFTTSCVEDVRFADRAATIHARQLLFTPLDAINLDTCHSEKCSVPCVAAPSLNSLDVTSLLCTGMSDKIRSHASAAHRVTIDQQVERQHRDRSNEKAFKKAESQPASNSSSSKSVWFDSQTNLQMSSHLDEDEYSHNEVDNFNGHSLGPLQRGTVTELRKRVRVESSLAAKLAIVFCLIVRLQAKRPLLTLTQLAFPAIAAIVLACFMGGNPYQIAVAVYNPDSPSIVSRHVLNTLDRHTIRVIQFATLAQATEAVREHLVWAAVEFPANYTNSMINQALQNCDNSGDEFEDEPEAESISGQLLALPPGVANGNNNNNMRKNTKLDRIIGLAPIDSRSKVTRSFSPDADLARVFRDRSARSHRTRRFAKKPLDELEIEREESVINATINDESAKSNSTTQIEPIDSNMLNDIEVNRRRVKAVNAITIRVHVDNTNLLVTGFVKVKLFKALQAAQADPAFAQFAPKIPAPLEIVQPNVYGHDDSAMADFLLPGALVAVIFISSAIIPLPWLSAIRNASSFQCLRLVSIGPITQLLAFGLNQLLIFALQIGTMLVAFRATASYHQISVNSLLVAFLLLLPQAMLAFLQSTLVLEACPRAGSIMTAGVIHLVYLALLSTFGTLFSPFECLPPLVRPYAPYIFPQTICAEALRYALSRGWTLERYSFAQFRLPAALVADDVPMIHSPVNHIVGVALHLPLLWIAALSIALFATIRLSIR